MGAGRTSVLRGLFGGRPGKAPDNLIVKMHGKPISLDSPDAAIRAGIVLVPEERASQGLILSMLVEHNIALPSLKKFLLEDEKAIARAVHEAVRDPGGGPASTLSGGNQQKIVLSKWMALSPTVLLLDEPTRGLDIKAKRDVHEVLPQDGGGGEGRHRFELGGRRDRGGLSPGAGAQPRRHRGRARARGTDRRKHPEARGMIE